MNEPRPTLEQLINRYEDAIFDPLFNEERTTALCRQVEDEAQRVEGNMSLDEQMALSRRLMALHTMFESAAIAAEK